MALSFTTMLFGIGAAETDTLSSIADKPSVSPLNLHKLSHYVS